MTVEYICCSKAGTRALVASVASTLAVMAGGAALVGWAFDIVILKRLLPGSAFVIPNTALALVLAGIALQFSPRPPATHPAPNLALSSHLAHLCGLLAGLIGLATLVEYASAWNPGFDQWLFPVAALVGDALPPGRMPPDTALCFVLLATGLEFLRRPHHRARTLSAAAVPGSLATIVSLTVIVSTFTKDVGPRGWGGLASMAVPAAAAIALLGVAIILLAWRENEPGPGERQKTSEVSDSRIKLAFLLVFLVLVAAIVATGTSSFRSYAKQHRLEVERSLSAILELKTGELAQWRRERLGDAAVLFKNAVFTNTVRRFLEHPADTETRRHLQLWLGKIQTSHGYDRVILLDGQGIARLAAPASPAPDTAELTVEVAQARETGQVVIADFHQSAPGNPIRLAILVPILDEEGSGPARGVLVLRIDPGTYLYALIQRWPTPSLTAETLLVRREGDDVVFLNELRHRPGTAMALRHPLREPQLPAARVARGELGVNEGIDYRGIDVVAIGRSVPDSPWYMIAKVDRAEIDVPIRHEAWRTGLIVALLLLTTVFAGVAFWRQRNEALLRRELTLEGERNALSERLALVTRYANDIILLVDETGQIVEANDRALTTYGYTLDELRHLAPGSLRPPAEEGTQPDQFNRVAAQKGIVYETVHRRRDGSTFPVEVSSRAAEIEGQSYSLRIFRDITDRKKAEEGLRTLSQELEVRVEQRTAELCASEKRFRQLAESAFEAILIHDGGVLLLANDQYFRLFGYTPAELLGKQVMALTVAPQSLEVLQSQITAGGQGPYEAAGLRKDGTVFPIEIRARSIEFAGRQVRVAAIADITDRKRTEETIQQLNDHLRHQAAELVTANKELEAFAYSVSHDLRAPLRAIDGFTRILSEDYDARLDDEGRRLTRTICAEARRMGALIDDLLAFSRMNRRQMELVGIPMTALVQSVFDEVAAQAPGRKFQFRLETLPPAYGDPAMIRQMLVNLISNAVKYTRPRAVAVIEIGGHTDGQENFYQVQDNGVGFDMKYAGKLFGVFQRLHTEEEFEGTGVGLALVQRVVHRHGGRVWAEAKLNGGATFHFSLPVTTHSI